MTNDSLMQKEKSHDFVSGLKSAMGIASIFFLVSLIGAPISTWSTILKISLGYGLSIYSMIWLSYWAVTSFLRWREEQSGKDISFGIPASFATAFLGLTVGALLAESFKAFILQKPISFTTVPFIILIGSFISLMFIYREQSQSHQRENDELNALNEKLKEKRGKNWASTLTVNQGKGQKVLNVDEILYFKSQDHYTFVYTEEGEFIVDDSLKKLSEVLDPSKFVQIHRNCIVALNEIASIENGNQWFVKTRSGEELKVSRNSRKKLKESL